MATLKSNTIFDERQPEIEITASNREAVIEMLNRLLADEHILMLKTHNYHWNVLGPSFDPMHKFFGEQYEMLDEIVDDVAERARALGGKAIGTMREYLELTRLTEHPGEYPNVTTMIANLLADHETIIRELRKGIDESLEKYGDVGTSDFLTDLIRQHEKMAWFLRSFLQE